MMGCKDPTQKTAQNEKKKETSKTGIFGKKTDQIGEFDPDANVTVSDGKMKPANPLNPIGASKAYGPAVEKISKLYIDQAVNLFWAEKGRYPRDYNEFMEKIIKQNQIKLPVLPGNLEYQYDAANHKLVVVEVNEE